MKFRVGEDGKLVRLTRGKPSPFWLIVEAPETAEGQDNSPDFKVLQEPREEGEKPVKSKGSSPKAKAATSKGISEEAVAALVASQVTETVADLKKDIYDLTALVKTLIDKVNFQSGEIVSLSSKLDALASKPAESQAKPEAVKKAKDSRKAKEDAKLAAMADLSEISEEMANIVTTL